MRRSRHRRRIWGAQAPKPQTDLKDSQPGAGSIAPSSTSAPPGTFTIPVPAPRPTNLPAGARRPRRRPDLLPSGAQHALLLDHVVFTFPPGSTRFLGRLGDSCMLAHRARQEAARGAGRWSYCLRGARRRDHLGDGVAHGGGNEGGRASRPASQIRRAFLLDARGLCRTHEGCPCGWSGGG